MCFSPVASFVTAGVTGAIGLVCLSRTTSPRELPLAATPLIFAIQQVIEGALWLTLPSAPDGPTASGLTLAFLILAETFWPIFAPLAILMVEPRAARRPFMVFCLMLGSGLSGYLLWRLLTLPHAAAIVNHHVVYLSERQFSPPIAATYLIATSLPLLASSLRAVSALGAIILIGCVTAYFFYWEAFESVWCFFAAAASATLLYHFERARRSAPAVVAA